MQIYRISGWFKQGLFKQKFRREVVALTKEQALERVYSLLGSRHGITRNRIHIEEVVEINPEEITDPRVLAMLE
ncbi:MAG: 50S ribosomal protein L18Ae [Candidatus Hadarchaeum sp.]|uniref:50S ribosomal protein L18Ae n=1 Tax=Candidatus Hadarchaeum sp. TaxID=2883567 RepID=UPI00316EA1B3